MVFTILIAFVSLIALIVIHELGHFMIAKRSGVRVEEFGIGYPPKIVGKKFGETEYSLNALPFGAFVRLTGEEKDVDDPRSFRAKPAWIRAAIILGGVTAFWIVGWMLFSVLAATSGMLTAVPDDFRGGGARVEIIGVASNSPAKTAGLKMGDVIVRIGTSGPVDRIDAVRAKINETRGRETTIVIARGGREMHLLMTPRIQTPDGEGPAGVALARVVSITYPWIEAPWQGLKITAGLTGNIVSGFGQLLKTLAVDHKVPDGVELQGPVGITSTLTSSLRRGGAEFISMIAMIALYLAVFNILPIPVTDGGKLLFLIIEAIRKKPINPAIEQKIGSAVFGLLLLLLVWVTIKDIAHLL